MTRAVRSSVPVAAPLSRFAFFLDVDGTLLEFASTPARARPPAGLLRLLGRFSAATGGALAIISGRSIADLDQLFAGRIVPVAGQHGLERRSASGYRSIAARPGARLLRAREQLARTVARHAGLLLEDKGLSLALHYRRAPRLGGFVHRIVRGAGAQLGRDYAVLPGRYVAELRPAGRNKGIAVHEFMREAPFRRRIPVYVGDDVTDEYAFRTVNRLGGRTIKVGPGATSARARLADARTVRRWLEALLRSEAGR